MPAARPPRLHLLALLLLAALSRRFAGAGLVEAASEVLNFPGAPRTDPISWAFPAQDDRNAMAGGLRGCAGQQHGRRLELATRAAHPGARGVVSCDGFCPADADDRDRQRMT